MATKPLNTPCLLDANTLVPFQKHDEDQIFFYQGLKRRSWSKTCTSSEIEERGSYIYTLPF